MQTGKDFEQTPDIENETVFTQIDFEGERGILGHGDLFREMVGVTISILCEKGHFFSVVNRQCNSPAF
jgi:hypothetical protein